MSPPSSTTPPELLHEPIPHTTSQPTGSRPSSPTPQPHPSPSRASPRTDPPLHLSTYRLATLLTIPLTFSLLLFWVLSHRDPALVIHYDYLPIAFLVLLSSLFL